VNLYFSDEPENLVTEGFIVAPGQIINLIRRDGDHPEYAWYAMAASGTCCISIYVSMGRPYDRGVISQ